MTKKLHQLEQIRLEHDWSYQDLANAIAETVGYTRDQDCWRKICQHLTTKPNSTTQHILDKFLVASATAADSNGHRKRRAS